MADRNYLIGFGERLIQPIKVPGGGGPKAHPYRFSESKQRLMPKLQAMVGEINQLPELACPDDETVIGLTLHPTYLAKSYYPTDLLRDLEVRAVGSHARRLIPEHRTSRKARIHRPDTFQPGEVSPEFYVAGSRASLSQFADTLSRWTPKPSVRDDFRKLEDIRALDETRLRPIESTLGIVPLEVVLHASGSNRDAYVIEGFRDFARSLDLKVDLDQRIYAGGLCFLPMRAPLNILDQIVQFSFLRVMRQMPKLAMNDEILRSVTVPGGFQVTLPSKPPINPDIKVAVFDGGLPDNAGLDRWVSERDAPGVGPSLPEFRRHGLGVTSALLFGPLKDGTAPPTPYASVDHWRVLDSSVRGDDLHLWTVLQRIINVLRQREYQFVNLSIGPSLPIEDDDVHVWTAIIDEHLSNGTTVLTTAAGNTGDQDWPSGNARIQPCADAVNALSVGAASSQSSTWERAKYSSIGPGRSPGYIKPDLLAFGGESSEPFWLLDDSGIGQTSARIGTSYASPCGLRSGLAMKAHFGAQLSAPAIRSLMVHHSEPLNFDRREVGWGRLPDSLDDLVVCGNGEAHIVFQGILEPTHWIRVPIPMPEDGVTTRVNISATFCFFSSVDPEDSLNYTRSGLDIRFRPKTAGPTGTTRRPDGTVRPRAMHKTSPFFRNKGIYVSEIEHRSDAHKWETVIRRNRTFNPGTLDRPVFDIDYQARIHGKPAVRPNDVPYALVVTVNAPKEPDLYNRILAEYRTQLEVLQPIIEVPITIR